MTADRDPRWMTEVARALAAMWPFGPWAFGYPPHRDRAGASGPGPDQHHHTRAATTGASTTGASTTGGGGGSTVGGARKQEEDHDGWHRALDRSGAKR